ncbi:GNAT family N-acetyltransferase [Bowmanella dokdonensis]|uniref:GNAT family N-acetyltransferase n=1 Tax=Bowmanella dokdonensis TaxID=751969 RepID=A0A939DNZ8_9ALTE|nr:GNAT family N-acetyltransferase [Bowmanella dokdonensis]
MISIRQATQADIDILYELILAIARHHGQEQFVVTSKAQLQRAGFGPHPRFGALLAEIDGEIAGYASFTWNYSIWLGSELMTLDDLFVWDRFRGRKIGEALMQELSNICRTRDIQRIKWEVQQDNHQAIKFYRRLGAEVEPKGVCRWNLL